MMTDLSVLPPVPFAVKVYVVVVKGETILLPDWFTEPIPESIDKVFASEEVQVNY